MFQIVLFWRRRLIRRLTCFFCLLLISVLLAKHYRKKKIIKLKKIMKLKKIG